MSPMILMRFATGDPCTGCLYSPVGEENCTELLSSVSPMLPHYPEGRVDKSAGSVR